MINSGSTTTWLLGCHDTPRVATRYGLPLAEGEASAEGIAGLAAHRRPLRPRWIGWRTAGAGGDPDLACAARLDLHLPGRRTRPARGRRPLTRSPGGSDGPPIPAGRRGVTVAAFPCPGPLMVPRRLRPWAGPSSATGMVRRRCRRRPGSRSGVHAEPLPQGPCAAAGHLHRRRLRLGGCRSDGAGLRSRRGPVRQQFR